MVRRRTPHNIQIRSPLHITEADERDTRGNGATEMTIADPKTGTHLNGKNRINEAVIEVVIEEEATEMTGAQITCAALEAEGVTVAFGYPGGAVIPLYDALPDRDLHHVLVRFEQWAALAAEGYARVTGKVGCLHRDLRTGRDQSGHGFANAMLDSVPIVAITGQVVQPLIGRDAFQEVDITGITLPVTKHNYLVQRIEDIAPTIKEAFHLARSGRPGPVLIDIPKKLFMQKAEYVYPTSVYRRGYQPTSGSQYAPGQARRRHDQQAPKSR